MNLQKGDLVRTKDVEAVLESISKVLLSNDEEKQRLDQVAYALEHPSLYNRLFEVYSIKRRSRVIFACDPEVLRTRMSADEIAKHLVMLPIFMLQQQ